MKPLFLPVLFLLFLTHLTPLHARSRLRYQATVGYAINTFNQNLFSNWGRGWMFGGGVGYAATSRLVVTLKGAYTRYTLTGSFTPYNIPDTRSIGNGARGEGTHTVGVTLELRYELGNRAVRPFIYVGAGAAAIDLGKMFLGAQTAPVRGTGRMIGEFRTDFGFGVLGPELDGYRLGLQIGLVTGFQTGAEIILIRLLVSF